MRIWLWLNIFFFKNVGNALITHILSGALFGSFYYAPSSLKLPGLKSPQGSFMERKLATFSCPKILQNGLCTKQVVLEYILQALVLPAWTMPDIAWKHAMVNRNSWKYKICRKAQFICIFHSKRKHYPV